MLAGCGNALLQEAQAEGLVDHGGQPQLHQSQREREKERGGGPKVPETSNGRQPSLEKAKVSVVSLAPKR